MLSVVTRTLVGLDHNPCNALSSSPNTNLSARISDSRDLSSVLSRKYTFPAQCRGRNVAIWLIHSYFTLLYFSRNILPSMSSECILICSLSFTRMLASFIGIPIYLYRLCSDFEVFLLVFFLLVESQLLCCNCYSCHAVDVSV